MLRKLEVVKYKNYYKYKSIRLRKMKRKRKKLKLKLIKRSLLQVIEGKFFRQ